MRFVPLDPSPLPGWPVVQQHPFYGDALRLLGLDVLQLTVRADAPVAHLQAVARRVGPLHVSWVPQGLLWAESTSRGARYAALAALPAALSRPHLRLIAATEESDHDILHSLGYRKVSGPQSRAWVDLTADTTTRLSSQHGKWRNRLRHAQATRLQVSSRPFCPSEDTPLLQLEQAQRRKKGYRALPMGFTLAWATAHPAQIQVFEAQGREGLAAFIIVLTHAPTASYHIGWTSDEGRAASAHNLLLWQAATWLAERKFKALDLGLVDPHRSPGLARFKLGMGAEMRTGGATYLSLPRLRLPLLGHRAA